MSHGIQLLSSIYRAVRRAAAEVLRPFPRLKRRLSDGERAARGLIASLASAALNNLPPAIRNRLPGKIHPTWIQFRSDRSQLQSQREGQAGEFALILHRQFQAVRSGEFSRLPARTRIEYVNGLMGVLHARPQLWSHVLEFANCLEPYISWYFITPEVRLSDQLRLYDQLLFLYWCNQRSIADQAPFDTQVVRPFAEHFRAHFGDKRPGKDRLSTSGNGAHAQCRIALLAQFCFDGNGNGLAPVIDCFVRSMHQHRASQYQITLFAWFHKTESYLQKFRNLGIEVCEFDLTSYSETELARLCDRLSAGDYDVIVSDMNSAVPTYLFERRTAPIQIYYQLGMPYWGISQVDGVLLGWESKGTTWGFPRERCYALPRFPLTFDYTLPVSEDALRAERALFPAGKRVIGCYGRLVKFSADYLRIVAQVLSTHPDVIVALGGTGDRTPLDRWIRELQLDGRVFVVDRFVDGLVWSIFLEIFLDTWPLTGGFSCLEAQAKGVPVVFVKSAEMENLAEGRDPELEAHHPDEYVAHLSRLLDDPVAYQRAAARARGVYLSRKDTRAYAEGVDGAIRDIRRRLSAPV